MDFGESNLRMRFPPTKIDTKVLNCEEFCKKLYIIKCSFKCKFST